MEPTIREQKVLDAIKKYYEQAGYAPSFRDISSLTGIKSLSMVKETVDSLVSKGYAIIAPNVARSLRLTAKGSNFEYKKPKMVAKPRPQQAKKIDKKSALREALGLSEWC